MEDLFSLLIFAFFLWSMLGGLFGKKKGAPPQQRRPGQSQHPAPDDHAGPRHGPSPRPAARHGDEESAADMVPDDLWAILTGETRKPVPRPEPRAEQEPEPRWEAEPEREVEPEPKWEPEPRREPTGQEPTGRPAWEDDEALEEEGAVVVATRSYEETLARRQLEAPEPEIDSLETLPPPSEVRHAQFHERLDALRKADAERRARERRGGSTPRQRSLRRAMVLREVLGPPKGLE